MTRGRERGLCGLLATQRIGAVDRAVTSEAGSLLVVLALWTGQRQGDPLRLTWSAYDGAYLRLCQGKTRKRVTVPVGATLAAALPQIPRAASTQVLNSSLGKP